MKTDKLGNTFKETEIEGKTGRMPIITADSTQTEIDDYGNVIIRASGGIMPVVALQGGGAGAGITPTLQEVTAQGSSTDVNIQIPNAVSSTDAVNKGQMDTELGNKANKIHTHTKAEVGLNQVDNTADANKPISTATQTALNNKADKIHNHSQADVSGLAVTLAGKADKTHTHTNAEAGLSNVDNTSDADKPVSAATQLALNNKADKIHSHSQVEITGLVTSLSGKADKAHAHTKAELGLANVDNTSDANKPVSIATQTAINNIQIGARNYILNSNFYDKSHWRLYSAALSYTLANNVATVTFGATNTIIYSNDIQFYKDQEYILSADIRSDAHTALTYNYLISTANGNQSVPPITGITTQWKRYSIKIKPTADRLGGIGFGCKDSIFQFRNVQLELGNKPSDWAPNPQEITKPNSIDPLILDGKLNNRYIPADGRNLLKNSNFKSLSGITTNQNTTITLESNGIKCISNQATSTPGIVIDNIIKQLSGKHTITVNIILPPQQLRIYFYKKSDGSNVSFVLSSNKTIITHDFALDHYKISILFSGGVAIGDNFTIQSLMLENGSTASIYSPASEDYIPYYGGRMDGNLTMGGYYGILKTITKTSHAVTPLKWVYADEPNRTVGQIGLHSTGGAVSNPGSMWLVPYEGHASPWNGDQGLFITKDNVKFENNVIHHQGNYKIEDGAWTPNLIGSTGAGAATYTKRIGCYYRVGNMVTVTFEVSGDFTTKPTGNVTLSGLPIAIIKHTNNITTNSVITGFSAMPLTLLAVGATTYLSFLKAATGLALYEQAAIFGTDVSDTKFSMRGSITYKIA